MQRSLSFYHDGLGFPTSRLSTESIIFFQTGGICLALNPSDKLAEDVSPDFPNQRSAFSGITMTHVARKKEDVDEILVRAGKVGGKIEKPAQDVFWGGYSGYFSDPDGYLWEVAFSDSWEFNEDGSLVTD